MKAKKMAAACGMATVLVGTWAGTASGSTVSLVHVESNVRVQAVPNCHSSFDVYQYTPSALTSCGIRTFPRTADLSLPDGGHEYTYRVGADTVRYRVPPAGFNALRATAAEQSFYGFPPKPSNPSKLARWTDMMSHVKVIAPPAFLAELPHPVAGAYSPNWSGYVANTSDIPSTSMGVYGSWYEFSPSASCSGSSVVVWSGMGGYNGSDQLARDGTGYNFAGMQNHEGWTEILPAGPLDQRIEAHPGYYFEADVSRTSTGVSFYLFDGATYEAASALQTWMVPDTSTGEFIVERPYSGSSFYPLANFSSEAMSGYIGPQQVALGSLSPTPLTMTNSGTASGTLLADPQPTALPSGQASFTDHYDGCQ